LRRALPPSFSIIAAAWITVPSRHALLRQDSRARSQAALARLQDHLTLK
jgi:hypothetical protein